MYRQRQFVIFGKVGEKSFSLVTSLAQLSSSQSPDHSGLSRPLFDRNLNTYVWVTCQSFHFYTFLISYPYLIFMTLKVLTLTAVFYFRRKI